MFVDERTIHISGGKGGDGIVHWHREKYLPKGGPDGGDGGKGGDVYIESVRDIHALERYTQNAKFSAPPGAPGGAALRTGKDGDDLILRVPVGSTVTNTETMERFEFTKEGERVLVAVGGRGGFGNAHFKSSTNTTPKRATHGQDPQIYTLTMNLALIADVGIIGLPNAGKSTLLNILTNASAKVAAYPFTTLEPNIGMFHQYTLADIPGLIEDASEGKGLGHTFLKHISKTRVLVHLVSAENEEPDKAYRTVLNELSIFDETLKDKKQMVVLSKTDVLTEEKIEHSLSALPSGTIQLTAFDDEAIALFEKKLLALLAKEEGR